MLSCLNPASLKSVAAIALVFSVSTPALATGTQASKSSKTYFATQAVLADEAGKPICAVDVAGLDELVPHGVRVAPEGFESKVDMRLRACNKLEMAEIWQLADISYQKTNHQLLPVAVGAAWTVCQITGAVGVLTGAYFDYASGDFNKGQLVPGLAGGVHEGVGKLAQKSVVGRGATGGVVGLVCGAVGHGAARVAKKGIRYVMENGLPEAKAPKHRTR